jgi:phage terminase small subunit
MKAGGARRPPKHLTAAGKALWKAVAEGFRLGAHQYELLVKACEAADEGEAARVALVEHGTVYTDRFGAPRARPEVAIERDCRLAVARLMRELALEPGESAPRLPRAGGRT